jgi:hypothetical protein
MMRADAVPDDEPSAGLLPVFCNWVKLASSHMWVTRKTPKLSEATRDRDPGASSALPVALGQCYPALTAARIADANPHTTRLCNR